MSNELPMLQTPGTAIPGMTKYPEAEERPPSSPAGLALGATLLDDARVLFRVWAPQREKLEVHLVAPRDRRVPMTKGETGYHEVTVDECGEGARYFFVLDGGDERPDPASRHQPEGVHGPSEVIGRDFAWSDDGWRGLALEDLVVYELHPGTFTGEGTFGAIIPHLDELKAIGITAIELLPVAQFPGSRNWGYDGTYVGAAQTTYGGPRELKRLVDACHQRGLAIFLDVVYNHLGPEGNYLGQYGPYFTDRYKTPWGLALNFDGPYSDDVRWFFIHNALQWVDEFHFDGLRVDAVHAIVDHSAEPFLQDLNRAVHRIAGEQGRRIHSIAESDLNDPRVITPAEDLGLGFDSQWADDFHHAVHTLLTREQDGYYQGFPPSVGDLARILTSGYLYTGQHSAYRRRKYGLKPKTRNGAQFVISMQNHDQVGNRMMGERLTQLVSPAQVRLAAALMILSPFVPMLFMGEEYGEQAPFQYFTSHGDPDLIEAVRQGRREEFDDFTWAGEPPDPHAEATYEASRLRRRDGDPEQEAMRSFYRSLFTLRREQPALRSLDLGAVEAHAVEQCEVLIVSRGSGSDRVWLAFNFSGRAQAIDAPFARASWRPLMATGAEAKQGRLELPAYAFGVWTGLA